MSDVTTEPGHEAVDDVILAAEPEAPDAEVGVADDATEPGSESAPESDAQPEPDPPSELEPEPTPEPEPVERPMTLDELVADLAKPDEDEPSDAADEAAPEQPEPESEFAAEPAAEPAIDAEPEAPEEPIDTPPLLKQLWTRVPFWAVDGVWLTLTAASTIALWNVPSLTYQDGALYALLVLGGAALAVIGLAAGLAVWLVARSRSVDHERAGLGLTIWTRALAWTAAGVAQWWIGLLILSLHHHGVIG
jgi:hypothetical protein